MVMNFYLSNCNENNDFFFDYTDSYLSHSFRNNVLKQTRAT